MRMTLDLPNELVDQAALAANARGISLPDLVLQALRRELAASALPPAERRKVDFPIYSSQKPGTLVLTADTLAALEVAEELRQYGLAD